MKFGDHLHLTPVPSGFEVRVYADDGLSYRAVNVTTADAWRIVGFIGDVEQARKMGQAEGAERESRMLAVVDDTLRRTREEEKGTT